MKIRDKVLNGRKCLLKEENCYHTKFYISKKYRYSVGARSLSSLKCLYGEPTRISQPSARFTGHNSCDSRNMNFWKCHMISSSKGHVTLRMRASNCESAFCLFSCSWIFCRWRLMYLICYVTSHDHFIQRACEFIGGNSLCYVTTLISLVNGGIVRWRYVLNLSRDLAWAYVERAIWIYG